MKINDDKSFKLKALIEPNGKEDSDREIPHTEFCICPLSGISTVISTATVREWRVVLVDSESAFLQSGPSKHI